MRERRDRINAAGTYVFSGRLQYLYNLRDMDFCLFMTFGVLNQVERFRI